MITTDINRAAEVLNNNELVAIPTETVYGLAGNGLNETAIKKIFELKKRPFFNPLILHIQSADYLEKVAQEIPEKAHLLAKEFWPGPLTMVLKKQAHIPSIVTAGKETVAVRVPNHPVTLALLDQLDFPLAAPSANPFGSISPTSSSHVLNYFQDCLEVILEGGNCENGVESTILGFENGDAILYRHGALSIEEIEKVIGKIKVFSSEEETEPVAPGMLSRHYAPKTQTYLTDNLDEVLALNEGKKIGLLLFKNAHNHHDSLLQEIVSPNGYLKEAAKNLYAALHRLDHANLDVIIAELFPNQGLGKTINDRLTRAVKRAE
jgi:L-threonylcarbamoyladenylate synthase